MHHSHRAPVRSGDHVDGLVWTGKLLVENYHRERRSTGGDVSRTGFDGIGGHHTGARVTLGRTEGNSGTEMTGRVEERSPLSGQGTCIRTRGKGLREDIQKLPRVLP